jgi:diamine N-acetyltransferase
LELVTQDNVRDACGLQLRPGQEGLVAPVAWSLADAYVAPPGMAWPRLVYDGDDLVGFMMAAFASGNPNPVYHSYLWRLNISAEHQGRGYGRFAVGELCQEAIRRGQHQLTVSYHLADNGPEPFYRRLGFRPTGEFIAGETVAELILAPAAPTPPGRPAGRYGTVTGRAVRRC